MSPLSLRAHVHFGHKCFLPPKPILLYWLVMFVIVSPLTCVCIVKWLDHVYCHSYWVFQGSMPFDHTVDALRKNRHTRLCTPCCPSFPWPTSTLIDESTLDANSLLSLHHYRGIPRPEMSRLRNHYRKAAQFARFARLDWYFITKDAGSLRMLVCRTPSRSLAINSFWILSLKSSPNI